MACSSPRYFDPARWCDLTRRSGSAWSGSAVRGQAGEAIRVDADKKLFVADGKTIKQGDYISIDGTTVKC